MVNIPKVEMPADFEEEHRLDIKFPFSGAYKNCWGLVNMWRKVSNVMGNILRSPFTFSIVVVYS